MQQSNDSAKHHFCIDEIHVIPSIFRCIFSIGAELVNYLLLNYVTSAKHAKCWSTKTQFSVDVPLNVKPEDQNLNIAV